MFDVLVRPMREGDIPEVDKIIRLAFGTFLGMPDPMQFMGDADYAHTRYNADPTAAFTAEDGGRIVGSNFALDWGSLGIFGPLTIHPDYWERGVAKKLLDHTMKVFETWGTKQIGIFTFAQSAKHIHLYQKYGLWPRYLTAIMSKQVGQPEGPSLEVINFSTLNQEAQKNAVKECAGLTSSILEGLNLKKEILSIANQKLGDTIMLKSGNKLAAMALCHVGKGTEAGSGICYVKFGATRPAQDAEKVFGSLLDACELYAKSQNATRISAGANAGRHDAYRKMIERGFKTNLQGVAMQKPNEPGYNRNDVYLIDDWR